MNNNKFIEEKLKEIFTNSIYTFPLSGIGVDYSVAMKIAKQALSDAIKYGEEQGIRKVIKTIEGRYEVWTDKNTKEVLAKLTTSQEEG